MTSIALRLKAKPSVFYSLLFLYFFTTSADLLNIPLFIFNLKFSHVFSLALFAAYFARYKAFEFKDEILRVTVWLLLSMVISVFFSPFKTRTLGYIGVFVLDFLCFFLLPMNLVLRCDFNRIIRVYNLSFVVFGIYGVMQFIFPFLGVILPFTVQTLGGKMMRVNSFAYEPSYYALYMGLYVHFSNGLYLFSDYFKGIRGISKLFAINLMLLISTSTGAFLSYIIFFPVVLMYYGIFVGKKNYTGFRKKIIRLCCVFLGFVGLISSCFPSQIKGMFFKFFNVGFIYYHSFAERWERMLGGFKTFLDYPIFGVGFGGVGPYLYLLDGNHFDINTVTKTVLVDYDPCVVLAEVMGSLGLFGLLAFLYLFIIYWKKFVCFLVCETDQWVKTITTCLILSMCMGLISLQFNATIFRSYLWVHAALIYGILIRRLKSLHS